MLQRSVSGEFEGATRRGIEQCTIVGLEHVTTTVHWDARCGDAVIHVCGNLQLFFPFPK